MLVGKSILFISISIPYQSFLNFPLTYKNTKFVLCRKTAAVKLMHISPLNAFLTTFKRLGMWCGVCVVIVQNFLFLQPFKASVLQAVKSSFTAGQQSSYLFISLFAKMENCCKFRCENIFASSRKGGMLIFVKGSMRF